MGPDDQNRRRLAAQTAHPSSMARTKLCRQSPKVGARCVNCARRDLCGGRSVMGVSTAIQLASKVECNAGSNGNAPRKPVAAAEAEAPFAFSTKCCKALCLLCFFNGCFVDVPNHTSPRRMVGLAGEGRICGCHRSGLPTIALTQLPLHASGVRPRRSPESVSPAVRPTRHTEPFKTVPPLWDNRTL